MKWFGTRMTEQIDRYLAQGLAPLEEQIFPSIYLDNPEKFDLCYGEYINLLDNLELPYQNHGWITNLIMNRARTNGNPQASRECGKKMWVVRDKMSPEDRVRFLNEYFVATYMIDPEGSREIGKELAKTSKLVSLDLDTQTRFRNNLRLVEIPLDV
jgi:hypothetical protein